MRAAAICSVCGSRGPCGSFEHLEAAKQKELHTPAEAGIVKLFHVTGKTKIFEQPEYSDINELKRLANKLEDNNLITKVEEVSDEDDIKVYIGDENEFDSNCTIIRKKYHVNGEEGTIAVIGPKRMDYQRIVGLLEYIDDAIDNRKDT